jgi:hypothetical protein
MIFVLVSCGDRTTGTGTPDKKVTPMCLDSLNCGPEMADWTINSTSVNFPKRYLIRINDKIKADNCWMPSLFTITTEANRTLIKFRVPLIPKEALKIDIIDRGTDCNNNAIFHSEDSAVYGVITLTVDGKKIHSVSVNLQN